MRSKTYATILWTLGPLLAIVHGGNNMHEQHKGGLSDLVAFLEVDAPEPHPRSSTRSLDSSTLFVDGGLLDASPSPSPDEVDCSTTIDPSCGTLLCTNTCLRILEAGNTFVPDTSFVQNTLCNDGGVGAQYSTCLEGTDCSDCGYRWIPNPATPPLPPFSPPAPPNPALQPSGLYIPCDPHNSTDCNEIMCLEDCKSTTGVLDWASDGICDQSTVNCPWGHDCSDCGVLYVRRVDLPPTPHLPPLPPAPLPPPPSPPPVIPPAPPFTPDSVVSVITSTIWIDHKAGSKHSAAVVAERMSVAVVSAVPHAIVLVTIEQKLAIGMYAPLSVPLEHLDDVLFALYCFERPACAVVRQMTVRRRVLQGATAPRYIAFNVTRELNADEGLTAIPAVNASMVASLPQGAHESNLNLSVTLLGSMATLSAQTRDFDATMDAIIAMPSQLASDLGLNGTFIYASTPPHAVVPPATPSSFGPAPPPAINTITLASNLGGATARSATGLTPAAYDLIYQCMLLIIGLTFTYGLTTWVNLASEKPMTFMQRASTYVGICSFASSSMFAVSTVQQWLDVDGQGATTELRMIALLACGIVALSICVSMTLLAVVAGSSRCLIDERGFQTHRLLHTCIIMLAPLNFESVQLLPWRDQETRRPSSENLRALFLIPPLITDLPLAGVLGYFIFECLTNDALSAERPIRLAIALITATFVVLSLLVRIGVRLIVHPEGTHVFPRSRVAFSDTSAVTHATFDVLNDEKSESEKSEGGRSQTHQTRNADALQRAGAANRKRSPDLNRNHSFGSGVTISRKHSFGRFATRKAPVSKPERPAQVAMVDYDSPIIVGAVGTISSTTALSAAAMRMSEALELSPKTPSKSTYGLSEPCVATTMQLPGSCLHQTAATPEGPAAASPLRTGVTQASTAATSHPSDTMYARTHVAESATAQAPSSMDAGYAQNYASVSEQHRAVSGSSSACGRVEEANIDAQAYGHACMPTSYQAVAEIPTPQHDSAAAHQMHGAELASDRDGHIRRTTGSIANLMTLFEGQPNAPSPTARPGTGTAPGRLLPLPS
mmetsp:Transcript_53703/g.138846  ORF Transcript_53703/g.138846 Transcript_53703/m.138846 type:complete len:1060 (-) Transcript_53703:362-3541(-)